MLGAWVARAKTLLILYIKNSLKINKPSPQINNNTPRCYVKAPTAQDTFRPIPDFISCARVTGRWRLLSHAQKAVRWLAISKRSVEAFRMQHIFMQLSFALSFKDCSDQVLSMCKCHDRVSFHLKIVVYNYNSYTRSLIGWDASMLDVVHTT